MTGSWLEDHHGDVIHLLPIGDAIRHEAAMDCVCGPARDAIRKPTGVIILEVTHHRLDTGSTR